MDNAIVTEPANKDSIAVEDSTPSKTKHVRFSTSKQESISQTSTPSRNKKNRNKKKPKSSKRHGPSTTQSLNTNPGGSGNITEACVNAFLNSPSFELICVQAVQIAALLPYSPPPTQFVSFDTTPMHHWYQAILVEFVEVFMHYLRRRGIFPGCYKPDDNNNLVLYDDVDAFNAEATAHINSILTCFNTNFQNRYFGCTEGLMVDYSQAHASVAGLALREAISKAEFPPKRNWRVGQSLHAEYKRRLRMFEAGVIGLVADGNDTKWILELPGKLDRGINAYKEYYIANLRKEILDARRAANLNRAMMMGMNFGNGFWM